MKFLLLDVIIYQTEDSQDKLVKEHGGIPESKSCVDVFQTKEFL